MDAEAPPLLASLALEGAHAEAIRRYVESRPGWQLTDDGPLRPQVLLADVPGAPAGGDVPVLLLVTDDVAPARAATAAARTGAAAVLAWPGGRDRLARAAAELRPDAVRAGVGLTVGGAAGGVGTTTVALALAGLAAWDGRRVLALVHGSVPAPAGTVVDPADLAGPGAWRAATVAPGCGRLRVLRCSRPPARLPVEAGPAELVVRDLGVGADVDVLVVRRDRSGLDALQATPAGTVACADAGPVRAERMVAAAGGRRLVVLPRSVRVARADLAGRVPAALPGRWLALLRGITPGRDAPGGRDRRRAPAVHRAATEPPDPPPASA